MSEAPYAALRELLLAGTWQPHTPLREELLASQLGTSRTPVRDALRRLEADGLVEIAPRRGARVVGFSDEQVDSIFELRALLEGYAARLAAERGDVDVPALRRLAQEMERCASSGERGQIGALNLEFHHALHEAGGNVLLPRVLQSVISVSLVHTAFMVYADAELARSQGHHRELIEAVEAGDGAWAEGVMVAHIRAAHGAVRQHRVATQRDSAADPTTKGMT